MGEVIDSDPGEDLIVGLGIGISRVVQLVVQSG